MDKYFEISPKVEGFFERYKGRPGRYIRAYLAGGGTGS
jgi:hypothetical protein